MRIHDGSYRIDLTGAPHAGHVGAVLTGLPAHLAVDADALQAFVSRRAPTDAAWSTQRRERDAVIIEGGISRGYTTDEPVTLSVKNTDARPGDYALFARVPRPSHADYPARVRYGEAADLTGGGLFSGRMTVGFCLAGGLLMQELNRRGIRVGAHLLSVGTEKEAGFSPVSIPDALLSAAARRTFPTLTEDGETRMRSMIAQAAERGDSVGGVIECAVAGCPVGLGGALTDGLEPRLSRLLFAIPGVRGVAFGAGFAAAGMTGSQNNDAYCLSEDGAVRTQTNRHGGVLGGMTTGMPLLFTVAMKPTPSIRMLQKTLDLATGAQTELAIPGRHDACIAVRAVPVVEAAAAIILMDAIWEAEHETGTE